ncbi:MAG: acyl carrier protein [Rhodobacteraceae bacterium]|nr:acyl carrier protein [Paracoccaceae bacterium]
MCESLPAASRGLTRRPANTPKSDSAFVANPGHDSACFAPCAGASLQHSIWYERLLGDSQRREIVWQLVGSGGVMSLSIESLKEFLEFDLGVDVAKVSESSPLFSSGLIDSFALVSMMTFIETEGRFRISPADVTLENLDSIERILSFVERNREAA